MFCICWNYSLYNYTPLPNVDKTMSFFPHYAPFFYFLHPQNEMFFFRITEIGAHKLRLHAPFTMDIIKGRLLFDAFSDVFMSCICFADTANICGNKHIFIVIVINDCIVQNKKNEDLQSIMSNLQPNCCLKVDFQKVDQHTGYKWLIHDTKHWFCT